jgi:hypothetical protein
MTTLEEPVDPESVDRFLSALSTEANRTVVNYLRDVDDEIVSLDELVGHVADTQDRPPERVALRLHHGSLPKLADLGLLDYDPRSRRIRGHDHPIFEVDDFSELVDPV